MTVPFPKAWYSIALEGYRDHPEPSRTYSPFSYDTLPPLPKHAFDGTFRWLPRLAEVERDDRSLFRESAPGVLARLVREATALELTVPEPFVTFMGSAKLPRRVRSITGCSLDLAERVVPVPWVSGGLVRFLADSQGCLYWYLFLEGGGGHGIVVTEQYYGGDPTIDRDFMESFFGPGSDWDREEPPSPSHEIWCCAPDFESFVYRFWIENEIWLALSESGRPVNAIQRRYVNHLAATRAWP